MELHKEHLDDPFEVLRRLGGREIAAMVGAILAARMERTPVLLDGFVVCAARRSCMPSIPPASTIASPPTSRRKARIDEFWKKLGKKPLLDLGMRLGEGSGAALAIGIVKAALACHKDLPASDRLTKSACLCSFAT